MNTSAEARFGAPAAASVPLTKQVEPDAEQGERMDPALVRPVGSIGRVAYLTNAYPKVSHSFIRREILALEELGANVLRLSVRHNADALPSALDRSEAERTVSLLGSPGDKARLLHAAVKQLVRAPGSFLRGWRAAAHLARGSSAGYVRHFAYFAEACRVAQLLEPFGARHLHVHFGTNPAAVACLVRALAGISYSFTVHGPDEFDDPRGLKLRDKVGAAAFVVAISSFGRGQLMRWAAVEDWNKIVIVRCGLDESFLDAPPAPPVEAKRLLCVARLSGQKGIPLLLQAAAAVRQRGVRFELRIAGDGELRDVVEEQIAGLDLGDTVTLLGWQSGEEIRAELEACRAFVLPSFAEGLPVVLMEALALGRPVVTTSIAGIPELVDDQCGWLVPSGSVEDVARALEAALLTDDATLARMGRCGRERVLKFHDARANAATLLGHMRPFLSSAT